MSLIYGSVCSGIEAATLAWHPLGWRAAFFSEIDRFPCAVLAHHYPDIPNLGDMTQYQEWPSYAIDVLVGGTPCFPAGTLVLTDKGLVAIEEVRAGDMVLTHLGRFRRVLATGSKIAETITLRGQGHNGLRTTSEHPFWSVACRREWIVGSKKAGGPCWRRVFDDPSWAEAGEMGGRFWAHLRNYPTLPIPTIEAIGRESHVPEFSDAFFWFVGAWLGDGWARIDDRRGYVLLCSSRSQAEYVATKLSEAGLPFCSRDEGSTRRFQISSRPLARWLTENFGAGCGGKTVPSWCLGMDRSRRASLLDGYAFADGCKAPNGRRFSTISKRLAIGVKLLAISLGRSVSLAHCTPKREKPGKVVIEGREVNERPFYQLTAYDRARSAVNIGDWHFGLVREVRRDGIEQRVFNLEVEGDNSYTADGICVHNCQSFSVAGLRRGLADPRGNLALIYLGLVDKLRPRWVVWENVPGVMSSNRGRDFGSFLGGLAELGYGWAYRVLDAQYIRVDGYARAVPQRRRRVFVVGHLGDWRRAAAVLFERQSLSGNPPPRREAGKGVAPTIAARTRGGGGLGTDFDCDGGRGEGFDAAEDGTGRGQPIVAFNSRQDPVSGDIAGALDTCSPQAQSVCIHADAIGRPGEAVTPSADAEGRIRLRNPGLGVIDDGTSYNLMATGQPHAVCVTGDITHTLRRAEGFDASEDGTGRGQPIVSVSLRGRDGGATAEIGDEVGNCLRASSGGGDKPYVLAPAIALQTDVTPKASTELAFTLKLPSASGGGQPAACMTPQMAVRRLTPRECERLQGFPDNYTLIPYRGKPAADGPRYKALGNSMAVNVMRWIGMRIQIVDALRAVE
jgi:site-specific DNA-cytosine methylase